MFRRFDFSDLGIRTVVFGKVGPNGSRTQAQWGSNWPRPKDANEPRSRAQWVQMKPGPRPNEYKWGSTFTQSAEMGQDPDPMGQMGPGPGRNELNGPRSRAPIPDLIHGGVVSTKVRLRPGRWLYII